MIPVIEKEEPEGFCAAVRLKGLRTLACRVGLDPPGASPGRRPAAILPTTRVAAVRAMAPDALTAALPGLLREIPGEKITAHWTACLDSLHTGYGGLCAYLGLRIWRGTGLATVDHLVPKTVAPLLAYEWRNFRLSAHLVNTKKGVAAHLDPFRIEAEWFTLDLVLGEVIPNPLLREAEPAIFAAVDHTIEALHLNDQAFVQDRNVYIERARRAEEVTSVRRDAPFVYREAVRQGWAASPAERRSSTAQRRPPSQTTS